MSKATSPILSSQPRDKYGRYLNKSEPLVQVTVNNPLTAFKIWVSKLLANEGVDVRFRIHPVTAITIAALLGLGSFGLGRISIPVSSPIIKYLPQLAPAPTPNPWRETAFSGFLRFSQINQRLYLETKDSEAITLEVPPTVNLTRYIGRRIFATGKLNTQTHVLMVLEAADLEILPTQITQILESSPTPSIPPVLP